MEEDIQKIISHNIYNIINEERTTQRAFAASLGVSESTVGKWLLMKTMPRMGMIQKIADTYGLKKSDILEESKNTISITIARRNLIELVRNMNEEEIDRMTKLWELMHREGERNEK